MGAVATKIDQAAVMDALQDIPDPEIPVLTIGDLGIIRGFVNFPGCDLGHGRNLHPFERERDSLADADAHGGQPGRTAVPLQLFGRG